MLMTTKLQNNYCIYIGSSHAAPNYLKEFITTIQPQFFQWGDFDAGFLDVNIYLLTENMGNPVTSPSKVRFLYFCHRFLYLAREVSSLFREQKTREQTLGQSHFLLGLHPSNRHSKSWVKQPLRAVLEIASSRRHGRKP